MSSASRLLRIHPDDDLIVALRDLAAGETVSLDDKSWTLVTPVAAKHKFAGRDLSVGEPVKLFGVVVGKATQPVAAGELVHTHNLHHAAEPYGVSSKMPYTWTAPNAAKFVGRTFQGYKRSDGR